MEMIRTFRIIATEKNTHTVRDYKYTESYTVSGTTASVSYYDDEFTSLSYNTIDLLQFEVRAMPNKTSRKGAYYKARPLPSIASLIPRISFEYRHIQKVNILIPHTNIDTHPVLTYAIKYPVYINIGIPIFTPTLPTITVAKL